MSSWTDFKSSTLKYINSMGGVEVRIQRKAPPILGRAQLAANISLLKVLGNTYSLENQSFFPSLSTVTYCLQHANGVLQLSGTEATARFQPGVAKQCIHEGYPLHRRSQCKSLVD